MELVGQNNCRFKYSKDMEEWELVQTSALVLLDIMELQNSSNRRMDRSRISINMLLSQTVKPCNIF
jgi:hypothetical protein